MNEFRFSLVAEKLYHYFWHTFADIIIERSKKKILENRNPISAKTLMTRHLNILLRALHPFMPFVTEEIWSIMPARNATPARNDSRSDSGRQALDSETSFGSFHFRGKPRGI